MCSSQKASKSSRKSKWRIAMGVKIIKSDIPQPLANYSEAAQSGDFVFAAGQLASDWKTGVPAEARKHSNFPYYGSDIKLQTEFVLKNLKKTFEAAGMSFDNIVKAQVFLMDLNDFNGFDEVWKSHFKSPPPRTTVGTTGLLVKDTLVEVYLIGAAPGKAITPVKSGVPKPLANYAEAFRVGDFVFAAGQLASDFTAGVPPEAKRGANFPFYGSDIQLQTDFILKNLKQTFEAAGSSLDHVVKAQVFLTDLNDFAGFDEVWKRYFNSPPPRTTVGTTGLLVKDTLVEIDLIGYVPRAGLKHEVIKSGVPKPLANYSEAIAIGDLVFAAGQLASDFKTGVPPEAKRRENFPYYGSDIKLQTEYILKNLKQTFEAAGTSLDNVVKAQVFLTDLKNFAGFDDVWKTYFKVPPPRTTVGTTGLLVKDTLVEIDLIAAR
jgi:reactive intermediate/imine deaminase